MARDMRSLFQTIGISLAVVAGSWVLARALVQLARLVSDHWVSSQTAIVAAAAVGIVVSRRFDARLAQLFLLSVVATMVAEIGAHTVFGIQAVQGGETHLAVLAAGIFGVLLGSVAASERKPHRRDAAGRARSGSAESLAA